MLLSQWSFNPV